MAPSRSQLIAQALQEEGLEEEFRRKAEVTLPEFSYERAPLSFSVGPTHELPTLMHLKLREAVIRNRMAGKIFAVRSLIPRPRSNLEVLGAMMGGLIEKTVTTFYAADDPDTEDKVVSPVICLDAGERGKPWTVTFMPYPASQCSDDTTNPDPDLFDIDLHEMLERLFEDLRRISPAKVALRDRTGGLFTITASNPRSLFMLFERLYEDNGFPNYDSKLGSVLLPQGARPTRKAPLEEYDAATKAWQVPPAKGSKKAPLEPHFSTDRDYLAYAAARIDGDQDIVRAFAEDKPEIFMENLLPGVFLSFRHAAHNSACAASIVKAELSLTEIRGIVEDYMQDRPFRGAVPLLVYH